MSKCNEAANLKDYDDKDDHEGSNNLFHVYSEEKFALLISCGHHYHRYNKNYKNK